MIMNEHYYTQNPQSEHDYYEFEYQVPLSDEVLVFKTDAGVFSRHKVDFGSDLLIKSCVPKQDNTVLDMGCGYGAIGLSLAAREKSLVVTLSDINERAIDLTKYNAIANNLNIIAKTSNGFDDIAAQFDYIVFNPPIRAGKEVIYKIITDSYSHLKDLGELYIVIRKRQGGASMQKYVEGIYGNCAKLKKSGGYWILKAEKSVNS